MTLILTISQIKQWENGYPHLTTNKTLYFSHGLGITFNDQEFDDYKRAVDFIKKYIFPGSCLISIAQVTEVIKKYTDLSISHLEDITMHYATTLDIWRNNFLNQVVAVKNLGFSKEFIKIWEFYFAYCEAGFRERNIGNYQFVFSKPSVQDIRIEY